MMYKAPLTIGIEEEYQIIDPESRSLTSYVQQELNEGRVVLGDQLQKELMQSQLEVGTHICRNIKEARAELIRLRRTVAEVAQRHGHVIAAAGMHPFSRWSEQELTQAERYRRATEVFQIITRSMLIFGMHVHLGFGKGRKEYAFMMDVYNQLRYTLPHFLALSTSSPFWEGVETGLKSYRSVLWGNAPRTGIPPLFNSFSDYQDFVELLGEVGSLGKDETSGGVDNTMLWWDLRPRPGLGTLEVRICDMCTTIDEAISIAALIQTVAAFFVTLRERNQTWRIYSAKLIEENKWRAVRYGIDGKLIDFGKAEEVSMRFLAREIIEYMLEHTSIVDELGTQEELEYIYTIIDKGTSADRQLSVYRNAVAAGDSEQDALVKVVDHLVEETNLGL